MPSGVTDWWRWFISHSEGAMGYPFHSHKWPRQNLSLQYQADKWWEWRKISVKGLWVDPIPNSPNTNHKNCMGDSKEDY